MFGNLLCWGESHDSVKGFYVVVGGNMKDTVGSGFEWVSNDLEFGLCFYIGKTDTGCWLAKANRDC